MSMELDISRSFLRNVMLCASIIGFTVTGYFSSPRSEERKPMLLTPSLARVVQYQRSAQRWIEKLEEVNAELAAIQEQNYTDIFSQDRQISRVYGWLVALREEMDGSDVPPTLESLHATLLEVEAGYLEATAWTARWASEPTEANHSDAIASWYAASQKLQRALETPWLQVGP